MIYSKILKFKNKVLKKLRPQKYYKRSYSQCGEDLIVRFIFNDLGINKPSYIDIGAHHPFQYNNTAHFYEQGSCGINVEPNIFFFNQIQKNRKRDKNLNIGVSSVPGTKPYYHINHSTLNTFSSDIASGYASEGDFKIEKSEPIEVRPLNMIFEKYFDNKCPDLLSIDIEGNELEVLKSLDFDKFSPKVICAETISFSTQRKGTKNFKLVEFIESNGYLKYADTYINSIFVHRETWERKNILR